MLNTIKSTFIILLQIKRIFDIFKNLYINLIKSKCYIFKEKCGMSVKGPQINNLPEGYSYITAIT